MSEDAYTMGRKAYFRNLAEYEECWQQNPFEVNTFKWEQWVAGFTDACGYDFARNTENAS